VFPQSPHDDASSLTLSIALPNPSRSPRSCLPPRPPSDRSTPVRSPSHLPVQIPSPSWYVVLLGACATDFCACFAQAPRAALPCPRTVVFPGTILWGHRGSFFTHSFPVRSFVCVYVRAGSDSPSPPLRGAPLGRAPLPRSCLDHSTPDSPYPRCFTLFYAVFSCSRRLVGTCPRASGAVPTPPARQRLGAAAARRRAVAAAARRRRPTGGAPRVACRCASTRTMRRGSRCTFGVVACASRAEPCWFFRRGRPRQGRR